MRKGNGCPKIYIVNKLQAYKTATAKWASLMTAFRISSLPLLYLWRTIINYRKVNHLVGRLVPQTGFQPIITKFQSNFQLSNWCITYGKMKFAVKCPQKQNFMVGSHHTQQHISNNKTGHQKDMCKTQSWLFTWMASMKRDCQHKRLIRMQKDEKQCINARCPWIVKLWGELQNWPISTGFPEFCTGWWLYVAN